MGVVKCRLGFQTHSLVSDLTSAQILMGWCCCNSFSASSAQRQSWRPFRRAAIDESQELDLPGGSPQRPRLCSVGYLADMRSLARETGLTPHYVRNVFACAFLAPDIVEAILEGRQPLTLKFEHLYKNIPLSWAEQRREFGFPQNPRPAKSVLQ